MSRKQALETGAQIPIGGPHSVNGDGYRTSRKARNGAVCAASRNSERETRLVGCGCSPDRTSLQLKFPANREKYREFVDCGAFSRSERRVSERNQWLAAEFPTQRNREHFYWSRDVSRADQGFCQAGWRVVSRTRWGSVVTASCNPRDIDMRERQ